MPRPRDDRYDDEDDRPRRRARRDDDEDEDDFDRPRSRRSRDDDDDSPPPKKGMSTAVILLIVFGSIGLVVVAVGGLLFALLFPAINKVREAAGRATATNNLKQIGLAANNYQLAQGEFPTPFVSRDSAGAKVTPPANPADRLSWRVGLLPYTGEADTLYRRFALAEPWNSNANAPLAGQSVPVYTDPADGAGTVTTRYRCFYDNGAFFESDSKRPVRAVGVVDGLSNTLLYVESTEQVGWTQFNDFKFDPAGPVPALGHPTRTVFLVVTADGACKWVSKSISPQMLKAAVTKAGGEVVNLD